MSVEHVRAEFKCDGCGRCYTTVASKLTLLRRTMRESGWSTHTGRDYCSICSSKRRQA